MVIGILRADLHLHGVQSLKEKRGIVQKLLARCRNRFPVSAAEVGHQDLWQRTLLGFVVVNTSEKILDPILRRLDEELEACSNAELITSEIEFIHF
jgi:uncharacterized protein YlxP (DUF503 family)